MHFPHVQVGRRAAAAAPSAPRRRCFGGGARVLSFFRPRARARAPVPCALWPGPYPGGVGHEPRARATGEARAARVGAVEGEEWGRGRDRGRTERRARIREPTPMSRNVARVRLGGGAGSAPSSPEKVKGTFVAGVVRHVGESTATSAGLGFGAKFGREAGFRGPT